MIGSFKSLFALNHQKSINQHSVVFFHMLPTIKTSTTIRTSNDQEWKKMMKKKLCPHRIASSKLFFFLLCCLKISHHQITSHQKPHKNGLRVEAFFRTGHFLATAIVIEIIHWPVVVILKDSQKIYKFNVCAFNLMHQTKGQCRIILAMLFVAFFLCVISLPKIMWHY